MSLDTATELVNELQRLHMAYQRLVEENSSLKTSLSEMLSIKAENASLRIKLRSAQAAPQQAAPAAKPKRPEVEEEQLSEILARSDKSLLSRQMRETKDRLHASEEKLRERDAEVARLDGCARSNHDDIVSCLGLTALEQAHLYAEMEDRNFIWRSMYVDHVQRWLKVYPPEAMLIVPSEALKEAESFKKVRGHIDCLHGLPRQVDG
jgi:hypothetical protein